MWDTVTCGLIVPRQGAWNKTTHFARIAHYTNMTAFTKHTIKARTKHTRQDIRPKTVCVVSTSGDVCVDLSRVCSSGCCMVAPLQQEDELITGHWEAGPRLSKVWCQHQTGAGQHSQHRHGRGESRVVRSVWSVLSVPTAGAV